MGRKRGSKNADTDLKLQEALAMKLTSNKSQAEIAEELGVNEGTVTRRLQKAMGSTEVQNYINTSRNRLIEMLGRCDDAYHNILTWNSPENFGNQLRAATAIYKTFGLIQEDPQVKIQNIIPIQVSIQSPEGEISYTVGPKNDD